MAARDHVNIRLLDLKGNVLTTLTDQMFGEGVHNLTWPTTDLAAGAYFIQMKATNFNRSQKVIVEN